MLEGVVFVDSWEDLAVTVRCLSLLLAVLLALGFVLPVANAQDKTSPLTVGKNLPASFHPYNVTSRLLVKEEPDEGDKEKVEIKSKSKKAPYTTKGKFHCLITEYDLDPVVMLFVRGTSDEEGFRDLLQKIDGAIDRNPGVRLHSFVVFIDDDLTNVVEEDDKREAAEKKIQEKVADDLKLKSVVLTLASKSDVAKYELDPATAVTAVLYKKLRIEAVHKVSRDKLDKAEADAVKAIMTDVAGKLKATR
jgi:hypothetical protein